MASFIKALLLVVVAEMGDKTQLMTVSIAAENSKPLLILMGTTVGMLVVDGIGVIGGAWMCRHIPEIYYGQVCDIALSGQEVSADKEKQNASESVN